MIQDPTSRTVIRGDSKCIKGCPGLFLEGPENFSGPKSQLSNCNWLVLKSSSFKMFLMEKTKRIAKFNGLEPWC